MLFSRKVLIIGALATALIAAIAAGCGGDSASVGKVAAGPDEYAAQVCDAIGKHADDIQKLSDAEVDPEDPQAMQDVMNKMGPVLKDLSKDLDKVNPPSEVADWHDDAVSGLAQVADLFVKMSDALDKPLDEAMAEIEDLSSQMDTDSPLGSMSDLPDEYQQAFEDNSKCQELQDLEIFQ